MNTNFDITRIALFIRRQMVINIQTFWIALGALIGILLLISLLVAYFNPEGIYGLKSLYLVVLFLSGLIFTSIIFSELNKPQTSYALLTLPVSNSEKLFGAWLLSSPLFVVAYMIFMGLLFMIIAAFTGRPGIVSHAFNMETWNTIGSYMIIQTVFFLGACTFKGNNFLKTLFSIFIFSLVVGAFAGILFLILFDIRSIGNTEEMDPQFLYFTTNIFPQVSKILFSYVLGPFMLVVSYFKLKERQV